MRKEIIKSLIKPFFKDNLYLNKGTKFYKELGFFKIEVEIQSQRYYKDENTENFRINYKLTSAEFEKEEKDYSMNHHFYGFDICEKNSWIEINSSTNIENKKNWLKNELEKAELEINDKINPENLLEIWKEYKTNLIYFYLLKKFKPENLQRWIEEITQDIDKIKIELEQLQEKKDTQEKRENSLDKETLLSGINLQIRQKNSQLTKLQNLINKNNYR